MTGSEQCTPMWKRGTRTNLTLMIASFLVVWLSSPSGAVAADKRKDDLPRLVAAGGGPLEPSGLTWDPDLRVAVGVSDSGIANPGYEIFTFRPDEINRKKNQIVVQRLLTKRQSEEFRLEDLEGLTRTEAGEYFAFSSMSLDQSDPTKRQAARFGAVRFRLAPGQNGPVLVDLRRVAGERRPDLRDWLLTDTNRAWSSEARLTPAEEGGINLEGVADVRHTEKDATVLVVGFRGPLDQVGSSLAAPVLFLRLAGNGSTEVPEALRWTSIDLGVPAGVAERRETEGIRAMERIPGTDQYLVVLGRRSGSNESMRLVLWDPESQTLQERGDLPSGFRGEGVVVTGREGDKLRVLLVDDKKRSVLHLSIAAWEAAS